MLKSDSKKPSPLDRKLQQIEREKRQLEQEMKSISRAVKRGQMVLPSTTDYSPAELPKSSQAERPFADAISRPKTTPQPARGDGRFANYFSAGGLKTPLPNRKSRTVERNKVVFIVVVGAVLLFILISFLRTVG